MKKILCVLFLSLLIVGSVFAADEDFAGVWYLNSISMDGENVISIADMGMRSEMTLNEDGTAVMTMDFGGESDTAEGTWTKTEEGVAIVINEETQTAALKDVFLVFDTGDSGMMIYGREEPGPGFEPAEPDEKAQAADYEGTWKAFKAGMAEIGYFDWDMMSSEMEVETNEAVIKDGVLTIFGDEENPIELTYEESGVMANRFEDRDYAMLDTVATLRKDGTMTLDTMTMTFVFEKAEE